MLTHRQLDEWFTYMLVEPFGQPADDFRMATLAYTNALAHADPKKAHELKFDSYLPIWTGEKLSPSLDEYKVRARAAYAAATPHV